MKRCGTPAVGRSVGASRAVRFAQATVVGDWEGGKIWKVYEIHKV